MRLCERCAKNQRTCCEQATVRLTGGDVARISRLASDRELFDLADTSGWEPDDADPLFNAVLIRRSCRVLKHTERGCPLLSACGCALRLDQRPLICRLYPMSYRESGLTGLGAPELLYCPDPNDPRLLAELEMADEAQLLGWHRQLYEELRADYEELFGRQWETMAMPHRPGAEPELLPAA
jgi:Fe-S-cluster containining protein